MAIHSGVQELMDRLRKVAEKPIAMEMNITLEVAPGEADKIQAALKDENLATIADEYMQEVFVPNYLQKEFASAMGQPDVTPQTLVPSEISKALEFDPLENPVFGDAMVRSADGEGNVPLWDRINSEDPTAHLNRSRPLNFFREEEDLATKRAQDSKKSAARQEREIAQDMRAGFQAIWKLMTTTRKFSSGGAAGAGIGPKDQLLGLQLRKYMGRPGGTKSPLNSLFYAIEFGTGIAKYVGGPQYVNYDGEYKLDAPNPAGSWRWYDTKTDEPFYFKGQQGLHFLYDERTRNPREEHAKFVADTYGKFFASRLSRFIKR